VYIMCTNKSIGGAAPSAMRYLALSVTTSLPTPLAPTVGEVAYITGLQRQDFQLALHSGTAYPAPIAQRLPDMQGVGHMKGPAIDRETVGLCGRTSLLYSIAWSD
jgi:hypothetical protein